MAYTEMKRQTNLNEAAEESFCTCAKFKSGQFHNDVSELYTELFKDKFWLQRSLLDRVYQPMLM